MGHRMEVYVRDASVAAKVIELAETKFHVKAKIVGKVEARSSGMKEKLVIRSEFGEFKY